MLEKIKEKTRVGRTIRRVVKTQRKMRHTKIRIFFLCQYIQGWNKIEGVYREMEKDERFEVFLLAIPYDINEFPENKEYAFWKNQGSNVINAVVDGKWFDLKSQNPDYVFVQRPYDAYVPLEYRVTTLFQYTRLCYIPYAYLLCNIRHVSSPPQFSECIYMYFAENEDEKKYLDRCHPYLKMFQIKRNYALGYPSLDSTKKIRKEESAFEKMSNKQSLYKFVWTPRWTEDKALGATYFFSYKDDIVEFVQKNKDFSMVFRPHPMAFENFVQTGKMKQADVDKYLEKYDDDRLSYDNKSHYYETFLASDCLVTDFSSIILEYMLLEKPIILCHEDDNFFNDIMREISKVCYRAGNWEAIERYLLQLKKGIDPLKAERRKMAHKLVLKGKETSSRRIKNSILKDFKYV